MINFASLFGAFNRGGSSAINDLLDKPDAKIEDLMDVETFPNEYKSGNNKIIQFMKYPQYATLVKYVTIQSEVQNNKNISHKFPMVAADILSVQNSAAIDLFLPEAPIQFDVQYQVEEAVTFQVVDDDSQYLQEQSQQSNKDGLSEQNTLNVEQKQQDKQETNQQKKIEQQNTQAIVPEQKVQQGKQKIQSQPTQTQVKEVPVPKTKKTKLVTQNRITKKVRKQVRRPLMAQLMNYYMLPLNYTLAGYNCKVLTTLFNKKPSQFLKFFFNPQGNYIKKMCNHIESKSVGDLIAKILSWQSAQFIDARKNLYDHLISLMSTIKTAHIISNLAYSIYQIIEKTSIYIKSKPNQTGNPHIVKAFLQIFYRTEQVHQIINNTIQDDENISGYNCHILHAYLHHTQIQTFNSFKIEQVLKSFIQKASQKLRNIPNRRTLGMGRIKIVEIFSFLIRKPRKNIDQQSKSNEMTNQLLEQLYIHSLIAEVDDFFAILIKLVQSFENNNILHNEVFKIFESILKQPREVGSSLQDLLLDENNLLLKFVLEEAAKDKEIQSTQKHTRRKGYVGHLINLCKTIDRLSGNQLINQRLKLNQDFQDVINTMVAADIIQTNKSLAGYQMKKNPLHQIMFQKDDILSLYADFLNQCPKPIFQTQTTENTEDENPVLITIQPTQTQNNNHDIAERQLELEERDEQKFNQVVALSEQLNEAHKQDPKFWTTHLNYPLEDLLNDVL